MYFPVGWPKELKVQPASASLVHVVTNADRLFFAVLSKNSISIWYCKPAVQIVCFRRSDNSVSQFGANDSAIWKPDSSMVAVITSKGYIIFYKVEVDRSICQPVLYRQKEESRNGIKVEMEHEDNIPALIIEQTAYIQVPDGVKDDLLQSSFAGDSIKSMVCLREELMVATGSGLLQRIRWDGFVNREMTIEILSIFFSIDLQHSRASQLSDSAVYATRLQYSTILGGFALVLSNGRAAFITANTLKFEPSQVVGVWAPYMTNAQAVAINHKYKLIAFGCKSGEGVVFYLDDLTGALQVSHKLVLSSKDFPDAAQVCGGVRELRWTPDGRTIAISWTRGGFSLWSVFGSLLLHSMGIEAGASFSEDTLRHPLLRVISMEWGSEGYHLWMVSDRPDISKDEDDLLPWSDPHLLQLHFVKSALTVNPCLTNREHLFLQGEDKLYINPEDSTPQLARLGLHGASVNPSVLLGNRQWQIVPIPHSYLAANWPIRFAAVNSTGHCVAVAGKMGMAHYALSSRKWKLFGNETQEQDMIVTGGLTWWEDFICTACYNMPDQRDEVRFYPRDCKLDNTFAYVMRVPSPVILLNTFQDILLLLCADCHIMIFRMERKAGQSTPSIVVNKIQEVAIGNFIPHFSNVVAVTLTSIRTETASVKVQPCGSEPESIILNVAGKLLMFQRDRANPQLKHKDKEKPLPFCAPMIVASSVEHMWSCSQRNEKLPHLTDALWLGCGAAGMKVWLPLQPKEDARKTRGFMSKRIMLPFHVDIYPLALLFESGLILGATSESLSYHSTCAIDNGWPYLQLEKTSQVFLHHILRQLLRRNLGVYALKIARNCTSLPYFSHVLELLLHEVLEEEATSKEPIPDPLLPRVVAFVQEFPQFLQTVAHCARKTEVALWQYLFSSVTNPRSLFEECLMAGELNTASSYLIILQNMEKPSVAKQLATLLLDASLEQCCWELARNLVRFLRSIDPSEADSPHPITKTRTSSVNPATYPSPPLSPSDKPPFIYPSVPSRTRSLSMSQEDGKKDGVKVKDKVSKTDSHPPLKKSVSGQKEEMTTEPFFIDVILSRHARKLLGSYRLRDLACFAANLEDYQLVAWLKKERVRAARVEEFTVALKKLHEDFQWPLPIPSLSVMLRMNSANSLSTHSGLSEADVNGQPSVGRRASTPSGTNLTRSQLPESASTSSFTAELVLKPHGACDNESQATTELSDTSSALGDVESADSSSWPEALGLSELEQLSQELANKGPQQSELELRYLFQIMLEAGCLEWALLIAILLRDAMSVVRTVNTSSLTDTPIEIVERMREGLLSLEAWADTDCLGYKAFLQAIQGQAKQLQKIVEQNPPSSRQLTKRPSTSSTESTTTLESPHTMDREISQATVEEEEEPVQEPVPEENAGYECSLS